MRIIELMRRLLLIGIDAIRRLSLVCFLMRIIASFLRYTGYLNFINDPISRFITISSSCTTTQLSILLTTCIIVIKNHFILYRTTVYESNAKFYLGLLKIQVSFLIILKLKGFLASSLSTYDLSTLYTTLPHNLIKEST